MGGATASAEDRPSAERGWLDGGIDQLGTPPSAL
jgi:hypothetical protein